MINYQNEKKKLFSSFKNIFVILVVQNNAAFGLFVDFSATSNMSSDKL